MNEPVTLIGLGPMGQAMVRALLRGGHQVTVWNRTASRADGVVADGATRAATPAEAVAASELIILSLTDYAAMYQILDTDGVRLTGKTLVNLSSDTPEVTREAAAWVAERGGRFVSGGVMVPENMVGVDGAYVFYSGPEEDFRRHEAALRRIGRTDYVGADVGRAQLFYLAQLDIFLTTLSAYLHATALLASAGVTAREFLPWAKDNFDTVSSYLDVSSAEIDAGDYPGDQATNQMMGATALHILQASRAAGIDSALPEAVKSHYDRAAAAGRGKEGWTALIDFMKKPA
ncbi:NAD(P)-binding domain-containing protein [Pseudonocardia eucalypti]|uniref:NAD(P)-binding domain-containing protein n=1 Tax=Pseudonocardia eucalypti TaxID=648755 RepID=A0ABP9QVN9_9PSEU|nr:3-hydroxyisobutyrate dehydrogenase-like beta-hydroxyacid dehydrogenase [Pseudonocardia eucalypti]